LSPPADPGAGGLRERKKAKTREAIQSHALDLFRRQGYDATTVDQIIDAVDVSESTFYRYFPTKAAVALDDGYDPLLVEAFRAQPLALTTLEAIRAAFRDVFFELSPEERRGLSERIGLMLAVTELRAAMLDQFADAMHLLAEVVGDRTGRGADDPRVRGLAGAVVGGAIAVMFAVGEDPTADLATLMDEALANLESGFDF
jgi:AcrR family transcriptional regulator